MGIYLKEHFCPEWANVHKTVFRGEWAYNIACKPPASHWISNRFPDRVAQQCINWMIIDTDLIVKTNQTIQ